MTMRMAGWIPALSNRRSSINFYNFRIGSSASFLPVVCGVFACRLPVICEFLASCLRVICQFFASRLWVVCEFWPVVYRFFACQFFICLRSVPHLSIDLFFVCLSVCLPISCFSFQTVRRLCARLGFVFALAIAGRLIRLRSALPLPMRH